jgi:hypothetical protein
VRVDVENVSNGFCGGGSLSLWALGVLEPGRAGWGVVERVPKTAPKGVVFCHLTTGTETYAVNQQGT